ncbi:hypothetical protein K438DRAFT_2009388 [Mycena galopus ATCC 62051]|nr:hypothetical protein K438DRAFT_2009388 [Mycena galopus ATCC 62051]
MTTEEKSAPKIQSKCFSLVTLPSELVIKIFTTLIVDLGDAPPEPVVLRLASICKYLRELVINTPTLWSRIRLRAFPRDTNGAPLFIHRSQQCLLDVSVYFDFVDRLAPVIIQSYAVSRWRKLAVRGRSTDVKTFLEAIIETSTPDLTEVQLFSREYSGCTGDHLPLLAGASDALRSLTIHGCLSCLAAFPNLTKLNIFRLDCTYEEFRNLIEGSPNLTTLILPEVQDNFPTEAPAVSRRPLIEAPSLRYLAVWFLSTELVVTDAQPLLTFISMPNLEYLEVIGSRADYGELSGKPFPALKKLLLRNMNFPTSNAPLYRSFTKITSLEIDHVEGPELLTALDENGKAPWPYLQTLRCGYFPNCTWLAKVLQDRTRLTVEVPIEYKDEVLAISSGHDVQFFSDEQTGLIRTEDFARADWEDEEDWNNDSDFSDDDFSDDFYPEVDDYENNWDYDGEYYGMEENYEEDDDDGLDGVEGWF